MKQVFLSGKGGIYVLDAPVPGRIKDSMLVRNRYSLISTGTEGAAVTRNSGLMGLYEKAMSSSDRIHQVWEMAKKLGLSQTIEIIRNKLVDYTPIGYSTVGMVVEVDNQDMPFQPGDWVACMGAEFAFHAEYIIVPRNLAARVPDGVAAEQAAFAALACIAMQGIRRLALTAGERVGVIGLGLIGQITMRLLAGMGCRPYGLDLSPVRVSLAKACPNAEAWSLDERDSWQHVMSLTGGVGLDGVIICAATESDAPVNLGFDLCRKSGRVSIVGDVGLSLERAKMFKKELDLRMSCSYGPGRYDPDYEIRGQDFQFAHVRWTEGRNLEHFLWMLQAGTLNLGDLISTQFAIDEATAAYAHIKSGDPTVLGVLLDYGEPPALPEAASAARGGVRVEIGPVPPAIIKHVGERPIRLGIIGAGSYVKSMHLPHLTKMKGDFEVRTLVSSTGASAAVAARRFKVPVAASDYRTVLDDPDIDAVLIATRHSTHARFALEALAAGKHVFIEKPMTTSLEDAAAIVEAADRSNLIVRVGFNRRFSPYTQGLRDAIGHSGIRILYARVNIGILRNDWSNTKEEGGRLLGEGVHFYDLANWFMGSEPIGIAAGMAGARDNTNPNASVLLSYADGSHANVLYTSLGDNRMGKEFFEAFGNGKSARLEDFVSIKVWGGKIRGKFRRGDKGQRDCLSEFAAAVQGRPFPIIGADARAGLAATRIALEALEQARLALIVNNN
jgi:predicted dehydrogenase/threonine dehydrogenase-like Zn-dependent dehydrogenase